MTETTTVDLHGGCYEVRAEEGDYVCEAMLPCTGRRTAYECRQPARWYLIAIGEEEGAATWRCAECLLRETGVDLK